MRPTLQQLIEIRQSGFYGAHADYGRRRDVFGPKNTIYTTDHATLTYTFISSGKTSQYETEKIRLEDKLIWMGTRWSNTHVKLDTAQAVLKKLLYEALCSGHKKTEFCPRGPDTYQKDGLTYRAIWTGTFGLFSGDECILDREGNILFVSRYVGGSLAPLLVSQ